MKTFFFYILLLILIYLFFSILKILLNDLEKLTQYGYGYLTGQSILFIILAFLAYRLKPIKK